MNVTKEAGLNGGCAVTEEELAAVNRFARRPLNGEEVYLFCVRLCDNEVDRDGERFPAATLEQLGALFVGKTGVFDHQWSALGQTARIYRTELMREAGRQTAAGEPYCYLKGWAYMLKSEKNASLIDEIEAGIKKEVSVGCAVEKTVCSVCGQTLGDCSHRKGERYDGVLCAGELTNATDAYEWSFVAVPAQKNAGVIKAMGQGGADETLLREAEMGRRYLAGLRAEVARLGALAQPQMDAALMKAVTRSLDEGELLRLKECFDGQLAGAFTGAPQLPGSAKREENAPDGAFLI